MRPHTSLWTSLVAAAAIAITAPESHAQPPRSGGFDFTYGIGRAAGGEFVDRPGTLHSVELFFSTRMDGGNTPLLLGAQGIYFTGDNVEFVCVPTGTGCVRRFPDVGGGGLLVAFEPTIASVLFLHVNGGIGVVQPSLDGGPTISFMGAARIGVPIGRHFALLAGGRTLFVPDMRGEAVNIPAATFGLRIR